MLIRESTSARRSVQPTVRASTAPASSRRNQQKQMTITNFNPIDSILQSPSVSPTCRKVSPQRRSVNSCSEMKLFLSPIARTKLEVCSKTPNSCQMSNLLRSLRFNFGPKIKVKLEQHYEEVFAHKEVESLFYARCKDIAIPPNENLMTHFIQFCKNNCINNKIVFNEMGIGKNFTMALRNVFISNNNCTVIEMCKNSLGDEGAMFIAHIIKNTKTLVHVDISSNEIKQAGGISLFNALTSNETVLCFKIGSKQGLHRNRLGPQSMVQLQQTLALNNILTFLDLQYTGIGNEGLQCISEGIKVNKSLVSLNISGNEITSDGSPYLFNVFFYSKLLFIDLSENLIGNQGLSQLSDLTLQYKDSYMTVREFGMNNVGLSRGFGDSMRNFLMKAPDLIALRIDRNDLSSYEDITEICSIIHQSKSFSILSMNICQLIEPSVYYICNTFNGNSILKELNLGSNNICSAEIIKKLIEFVQYSNLKKMDLSNNHISDKLGNDIVNSLPGTKIEQLDLSKNYIKSTTLIEGKQNIAQSNVVKLNMKKNMIYKEAMRDIGATIKANILRRKIKTSQGHRQQITSVKPGMFEYDSVALQINSEKTKIGSESVIIKEREIELDELKAKERAITHIVELQYEEQKSIHGGVSAKLKEVENEMNTIKNSLKEKDTKLENSKIEIDEYCKEVQEKIKKVKENMSYKKEQYDRDTRELNKHINSEKKALYNINIVELLNSLTKEHTRKSCNYSLTIRKNSLRRHQVTYNINSLFVITLLGCGL